MRFSTFLSLSSLLWASSALPTSSIVLEKIEGSPPGWVLDQTTDLDRDATTLTLKIHLVNEKIKDFNKLALDVRQYYLTQCEPRSLLMRRSQPQVVRTMVTILITTRFDR